MIKKGALMLKVSLIYPRSRIMTGYGNYADRLFKGLSVIPDVIQEKLPVNKIEISAFGKPLFGSLSQILGSKILKPTGNIVHSLTPGVINSKTDIVTLHDIVPLLMQKAFANNIYRRQGYRRMFSSIRTVRNLIVFTEIAKKEVVERLKVISDNVFVVPQSVDHEIFFREIDDKLKENGKRLILAVGDLNPRKRYDILFRAVKGRDDLQVVHIGPENSWSKQKELLTNQIKDQKNVKMLGPVNNVLLRRYYSTSDLLVHLSEAEGFASPTVEAMACGTNVLVNSLPLFHETLGDMASYTSLEPEEVINAIDASLRNKKSSTDLIKYTQRYSIKQMGENTLNVYKKALGMD
jgi:glycosyltransferase involved in cell wall biosynthesis